MRDAFTDNEYLEVVSDLIYHPEVVKLKNYRHHNVSNRYKHSVEVSYLSYRMAKRLGLDEVEVARGALLHDLYHYDTDVTDKDAYSNHLKNHPSIAFKNACKLTQVTPTMKDVILCHMYYGTETHPTPQSKESWVVALADKLTTIDDMGDYVRYISEFTKVYYRERRRISLKQYSLHFPIQI